jgi:hypothetical protein
MFSSSSLLRLSVVIACLCLLVHAGPAPTLKRHNHKKASRLEEPLPQTYPPALTDALDAPKNAQATNTTELTEKSEQIIDSLKSIANVVGERLVELQALKGQQDASGRD